MEMKLRGMRWEAIQIGWTHGIRELGGSNYQQLVRDYRRITKLGCITKLGFIAGGTGVLIYVVFEIFETN